jgi:hypothetical protein
MGSKARLASQNGTPQAATVKSLEAPHHMAASMNFSLSKAAVAFILVSQLGQC